MTTTIPLDGTEWTFREALGETWRWYVSDEPPHAENSVADAVAAERGSRGWQPGRVPGAVIADLVRLGELPDPFVARNSRFAEWTKDRFWVYRRSVELPELAEGEFATLELDGVDPSAEVHFDGRPLGRVVGLFHRHRLVIPAELATPGPHWLTVTLEPAPPSEPQVGFTDAVTHHVPRMGYGWDFCPRLVHQGIWKSARVVIGASQLDALHVRPELVGGTGRVHVALTTVDGGPDDHPSARISVTAPDGREVATTRVDIVERRAEATLEVADPTLWWPHGLGEQAQYLVTVDLAGNGHDERSCPTGFRTIEWTTNPGAPEDALGYTCTINGRPLALAGWNWVPADALYGEIDPALVEHLVDLAVQAGARILRVWGGGLVESEHFHRTCDERGVLVWQEFSQSSSGPRSYPSEDPAFVAHLRDEARRLVPTLTHHPSLAVWTGGNELGRDNIPLATEDSAVLVALREVCAELDPGRQWYPTTPTGPVFGNTLAMSDAEMANQHDVHGPWEHQGLEAQHTLYNRGQSLAHTEFGVEGMTNRRTLDRMLPAELQWPCDRTSAAYRHTGSWWNNAELVRASFGNRIDDVEGMRRASQLMQATGLQYAVEADRRRSPRMSLVMPWQLNEPFPNAWCTSAVDHLGAPKPAYDAMARAFADRRVTLRTASSVWPKGRLAAEAWAWAFDEPVPTGSSVRIELLDATGAILAAAERTVGETIDQPRAVVRLEAEAPAGQVVVWRARWFSRAGELIDDERGIATTADDWAPLLDLAPAVLEATLVDGGIKVTNSGPVVAIGPRLTDARPLDAAGWPSCTPDPRPLLPGESRTVAVRWSANATAGPLLVECFDQRADLTIDPFHEVSAP